MTEKEQSKKRSLVESTINEVFAYQPTKMAIKALFENKEKVGIALNTQHKKEGQ